MKRRGFLKGLGAIAASAAVIIPKEIKAIEKAKNLTNLEKATKIDCDFDSPFIYVEARENIKQGDPVMFADQSNENPYRVAKLKGNFNTAAGICTVDAKKGDWFFVQTAGHCKLPANPDSYFKSFR